MNSPGVLEFAEGVQDGATGRCGEAVPERVQQVVEEAVKDVVWLDIVTVYSELRYVLFWRK